MKSGHRDNGTTEFHKKYRRKLLNSKGFSLLSTVMAVGLMGVVTFGVVSALNIPQKETRFLNQQFSSASLRYSILKALENQKICLCQFDQLQINTTISSPQEFTLTELRGGCRSINRALASSGLDVGYGLTVQSVKLSNIRNTGGTQSPDEYSGNVIVSYDLNPMPRAINFIRIPLLFTVDSSQGSAEARPFLRCGSMEREQAQQQPQVIQEGVPLGEVQTGCDGQEGQTHDNGGGFVASTATVAATAFVGPLAKVCDAAKVLGNARIEDKAVISGTARVEGNARVYHEARVAAGQVSGYAQVYNIARIFDDNDGDSGTYARISGNAKVYDSAQIFGGTLLENALVFGKARILGGKIYGNARVFCDAQVSDQAEVYGKAEVYGEAHVYGHAHIYGDRTRLENTAEVFGYARVHADGDTGPNLYIEDRAKVFGGTADSDGNPVNYPEIQHGIISGESRISGGLVKQDTDYPDQRVIIHGKTEMTGGTVSNKRIGSGMDILMDRVTKIIGGVISGHSIVDGATEVSGGTVSGGRVSGNARVSGGSVEKGYVFDNARVTGGRIYGEPHEFPRIYGDAQLQDSAEITDSSRVSGTAVISDYAKVSGGAEVFGSSQISGTAEITGGLYENVNHSEGTHSW